MKNVFIASILLLIEIFVLYKVQFHYNTCYNTFLIITFLHDWSQIGDYWWNLVMSVNYQLKVANKITNCCNFDWSFKWLSLIMLIINHNQAIHVHNCLVLPGSRWLYNQVLKQESWNTFSWPFVVIKSHTFVVIKSHTFVEKLHT